MAKTSTSGSKVRTDLRPGSNRINYTAKINMDGVLYIAEAQSTSTYERYTLIKEQEAEIVSADDINIIEDDFMDDLFSDAEDIDGEDADTGDINAIEKDDNTAVKLWKQKYIDKYKSSNKKNLAYYVDDDDEEDEEEIEEADKAYNVDAQAGIQDGNIKIIEPDEKQLEKNYFYKGKKILFDYYRNAPKVLNPKVEVTDDKGQVVIDPKTGKPKMKANPTKVVVKDVYGEENEFDKISLLINKALNFDKSPKNYRSDMYKVIEGKSYSSKVFAHDSESCASITDLLTGQQWGYEYKDTQKNISITVELLHKRKPGKEIASVNLKLPYHREVLKTNKASNVKLFKSNTYNRTVIFPDPEYLAKREGLNLGFMYDPDLDYEVLDTVNKLIDAVERNLQDKEHLAYDAETFGLKTFRWVKNPDLVCTHQISYKAKQAYIIPVRMKYCQNVPLEEANQILKPLLENKKILAHNGAADTRFLMPDNILLNLCEDTFILIRIIIPFMIKVASTKTDRGVVKRAIDDLVKLIFGWDMLDLHKYVFGPAGVDFDFSLLPESYLKWYGCPDTDLLWRLWEVLRPKLNPEQEHSYRQIVRYSRDMAIFASYSGIGVNVDGIKKARDNALDVIDLIEQMIYAFTGESEKTLPLSSPKKLSNYLFNKLNVPTSKAKKTNKGDLSADKHVMSALAEETRSEPLKYFKDDIKDEFGEVIISAADLNKSKYPFCMLHRKYADLNKDVTAFHNRILNSAIEGVYYEFYKVAQTDTYRDAGGIQITKKPIKYFLGVYNDNYGFCSMDYNTEEFRITVNRSTDFKLIKLLQDPESDAHTMVAAEMYGLPPSEIDKSLRDPIKACNFGIIYGMKVKRLTKNLKKTEHPTDDDIAEVQKIFDDYLYKRAEMLLPLESARDHVRDYGWIENDLGYRMIYSQVIDVPHFINQVLDPTNLKPPVVRLDPEKSEAMGSIMNRAGNYPIQSLAAAQLKDATIRLFDMIKEADLLDYIFVPLSVHDEIGVIYDKREVDPYWLFYAIHSCFYSEMPYLGKSKDEICPLYIGVGFGTSWGDAKNDKVEFPVGFQNMILQEIKDGTYPKLTVDDDQPKHFAERIKEYMLNRVTSMFSDMVEAKVFERNRMKYEINQNVFLGKKMHELFKTNDEVKDPVTGKKKLILNLDKYMELILEHNHLNPAEYTIIDGEEIHVAEDGSKNKDIVEFYYNPQPHPRVKQEDVFLTVDIRGLYTPVVKNLIEYLKTLSNPEYNFHNKKLRFMIDNTTYKVVDSIRILGVPIDFASKIDAIINHGETTKSTNLIKKLKKPPVYYDNKNRYIVFDLDLLQAIGKSTVVDVSKLINKYSRPKSTNSYEVVYMYGNKQFKYPNIFMDGLPIHLDDEIHQCVKRAHYTY